MAAVLTYESKASDATNGTSYTFSAQDIGTEAADRLVIVGVWGSSNSQAEVSSLTVAGVTATKVVELAGTSNNVTVAIFVAAVASGGTGDIVVNWASTKGRCGIFVWAATGTSATATDTDTDTQDALGGSTSLSCDPIVVAGGFFVSIIGTGTSNDAGGFNWTNATERDELQVETTAWSNAADGTASATITATTVNASQPGMNMVSASFQEPVAQSQAPRSMHQYRLRRAA